MGTGEITTLDGLLAWLFNDGGLRRFMAQLPQGDALLAELPSSAGTPFADVAFAAAEILKRCDLVDAALDRMLIERPNRSAAIDHVRARVPAPVQFSPARKPPTKQDDETKRLGEQLQQAIKRKARLSAAGASTEAVIKEILTIKRQLREGGQFREGDVLSDRYLLVRRIGRGGFAMVWEAIDQSNDDHVAVKVLHSELAGGKVQRQRFFRGARIMSELDHPAVVRVREREAEDGGFYYFVMDYLAGGDLRNAVLAGRLQRDDAIPIILRIGEALALAHQRGYLHRDVKPANILLSDTGEPFLTDFDLVAAQDTTGGTRTGALGTVPYTAFEMLERPQDADARADVFGLGMTMIFLLYGADLPMRVMRDADFVRRKLDCSAPIAAVLKRATSWKINLRPNDAGKFCDALVAVNKVERLLSQYHEGQRDFQHAYLRYAYLRGADLCGAKLNDANLRDADLRDANLSDADLCAKPSVNRSRSCFRGADLRGADLRGAKLIGADLRDAKFNDTKLHGADLQGADLRGADLRGAKPSVNCRPYSFFRDANLFMANLIGAKYDDKTQWPNGFDPGAHDHLVKIDSDIE